MRIQRGLRATLGILLFGFAMPALGQEDTGRGLRIVYEDFDPIWNVSGQVVAGVTAVTSGNNSPDLSILTWAETEGGPFACVDLVSRERSYRGRVEIGPPEPIPGPVAFVANSRNPAELRQIHSDQMAIRATSGACDGQNESEVGRFLIAGWGADIDRGRPDEIRILVNARTSEAGLRLTAEGWDPPPQRCSRVEDPRRTGYDFTCRFSLIGLPPGADTISGTVTRRDLGRRPPPARFSILLGD